MLNLMTGYLLIEPMKEEEKTKSGIVLPDTAEKEDPKKGKIIALGSFKDKKGNDAKAEVKKGDVVIHDAFARDVKDGDKEYQIIKYEDILAIVK